MPELPEVEIVLQSLLKHRLAGGIIQRVDVNWPNSVGGDPAYFRRYVEGRRVISVQRYGKLIWMRLRDESRREGPDPTVVVHLRMSGRLDVLEPRTPWSQYERVVLFLDHGHRLSLHDPRKFGRMLYVKNPAEYRLRLGIDALSEKFSVGALEGIVRSRRRRIKPLLLDQSLVAGLGNIYTDEALWLAGIHPLRRSDLLAEMEMERLHRAITQVLRQGIENGGTALGNGKGNFRVPGGPEPKNQEYLKVFRRTGHPCPRCGTPIKRILVAQRGTHICPVCQL